MTLALFEHLAYASLSWAESNKAGWNLLLTLRFGEERFKVKAFLLTHEVSLAISSAQIDFNLHDCEMPDEDWALDPQVELTRDTKRVVSKTEGAGTTASSKSQSAAGIATTTPSINSSLTKSVEETKAHETKLTDEYGKHLAWVYASGGPQSPRWNIRCSDDETILVGTVLKSHRFARARATGDNPNIRVLLRIPSFAIQVRGDDGALQNVNKRKIVRAAIRKLLCREPIKLYVGSPKEG